jgi:hypothetical protein
MAYLLVLFGLIFGVVPATAQVGPTATEIFELKKRCGEQGNTIFSREQKLRDETKRTKGVPFTGSFLITNFDSKTNNCYVLTTTTIQRRAAEDIIQMDSLWDGLSNELLASIMTFGNSERYGAISDSSYKGNVFDRSDITAIDKYIKTKLHNNR